MLPRWLQLLHMLPVFCCVHICRSPDLAGAPQGLSGSCAWNLSRFMHYVPAVALCWSQWGPSSQRPTAAHSLHVLCRLSFSVFVLSLLRRRQHAHSRRSCCASCLQSRLAVFPRQVRTRTHVHEAPAAIPWTGPLHKRGQVRKTWKLRHFELQSGSLSYFAGKGGRLKGKVRALCHVHSHTDSVAAVFARVYGGVRHRTGLR